MARKRSCLLALLLLLFLSTCLAHPLAALPAHRSIALGKKELQVVEQEADQQATGREARLMEEEAVSTLEIASNDYPGSGANNRHDPKTPARP